MYIYVLFVLFCEIIRRAWHRYHSQFICITTIIAFATGGIAAAFGGSFGLAALYSLAACVGLVVLLLFLLAVWVLKNGFR